MKIKTFRIGGIHPEENKLTHEVATQVAALHCLNRLYSPCRNTSEHQLNQSFKKVTR